ncbi:nodulation efficiency protein D (NfeD) [Bacteroidia bacterium]|nr:nodulation efficiency protein D (NfeD) [Bacteroidia bacterium]
MEWIVLIVLIVIGLSLILMEVLVLPGIGVAGFLGFGAIVLAVYLGYRYFGTTTGHYILLGVAVLGFATTIYAIRAKTWKKLSLHASIDSTVEGVDLSIKVGDTGKTVGRLAPMGKVQIGDFVLEAQSVDGYVDADTEVEVVKAYKDKVLVKLK